MGVTDRILKFFAPSLRKPSLEERANIARNLFRSCPACGKDLNGHSRWKLASVILDSGNGAADELAKLIREGQWDRAIQFQDWRGDRNEREYFVVRCPNVPQISLVTVVSTAGMWSDDRVESTELLDAESTRVILALVGSRWQAF